MEHHPSQLQYCEIPLPETLESVVAQAIRRGRRRRFAERAGTGLAALLAVVFLTANLPPLYAGAVELPLLGPMVRIMRVGTGGQAAVSGVTGTVRSGADAVKISFSAPDGSPAGVPPFSAAQRQAPRRLILWLHGVSALDLTALTAALCRQPAVADAYPLAVSDANETGVTVLLREGFDCSVGEYGEPGTLGLRFFPGEETAQRPLWYLCGGPMAFGPELAELTEALLWEGAAQVRLPDGRYQVTLGEYSTEAQAEQARQGIRQKTGVELTVCRWAAEAP